MATANEPQQPQGRRLTRRFTPIAAGIAAVCGPTRWGAWAAILATVLADAAVAVASRTHDSLFRLLEAATLGGGLALASFGAASLIGGDWLFGAATVVAAVAVGALGTVMGAHNATIRRRLRRGLSALTREPDRPSAAAPPPERPAAPTKPQGPGPRHAEAGCGRRRGAGGLRRRPLHAASAARRSRSRLPRTRRWIQRVHPGIGAGGSACAGRSGPRGLTTAGSPGPVDDHERLQLHGELARIAEVLVHADVADLDVHLVDVTRMPAAS